MLEETIQEFHLSSKVVAITRDGASNMAKAINILKAGEEENAELSKRQAEALPMVKTLHRKCLDIWYVSLLLY